MAFHDIIISTTGYSLYNIFIVVYNNRRQSSKLFSRNNPNAPIYIWPVNALGIPNSKVPMSNHAHDCVSGRLIYNWLQENTTQRKNSQVGNCLLVRKRYMQIYCWQGTILCNSNNVQ